MQGAQQCAYFAWADALPNKVPTPGQQRAAPGTGVYGTPQQASAAEGRYGDGSQPGPTQSALAYPVGEAGSQDMGTSQVAHSEGEAQDSRLCALHVRFEELRGRPNQATRFHGKAVHTWLGSMFRMWAWELPQPSRAGPSQALHSQGVGMHPGSVSCICMLAAGGVSLSPGQQAPPGSVIPKRGYGVQAGDVPDMSSYAGNTSFPAAAAAKIVLFAGRCMTSKTKCMSSSSAAASAAARLASS